MECAGADDLDVEGPLAERSPRGFPHDGKGLFFEIVDRFAGGDAVAELDGLRREVGVAQSLDLGFERVDAANERLEFLEPLALADPESLGEDGHGGPMIRGVSGLNGTTRVARS